MEPYFIDYLSVDFSKPIEQRIVPPVESWLRGFYDAKLVITDSFHGCVFSIIFGKPFIAIGNANRGLSRFTSLQKMIGAENHLVTKMTSEMYNNSFDVSKESDIILFNLKQKSYNFLTQALN